MSAQNVLVAHVAVTCFMAGVIWFVQVVHYPLMARVGSDGFSSYERAHTRLTGWIVAPAMLAEASTALLLLWKAPPSVPPLQAWVGVGILAAIWLSTATLQVPQHRALERGFDARSHTRLVRTNWIRTSAWTLRSLLVLAWI